MRAGKYFKLLIIGFLMLLVRTGPSETLPGLKVIYFLDPECPVTQSYMREIKTISAEYSEKGVEFEAIFPAYTVTDNDIQDFLKKYQVSFKGYTDKGHVKTKRYKAKTMPEAVLLDQSGMILYQGAIDNRYYALGKIRPKATELYLRNAIDATLNGNPVIVKKTVAIGCLIN